MMSVYEYNLQFNVSQMLKQRVGATYSFSLDGVIDLFDGRGPANFVTGTVTLLRTNQSILATCEARIRVRGLCSRCLDDIEYELDISFEEEYFPAVDIASGLPLSSPEEDAAFTLDEKHVLDLTEAIRQYTVTAMPINPLCRPNCAGLCPVCGRNRKWDPCEHITGVGEGSVAGLGTTTMAKVLQQKLKERR